ncbi:MAG: deoxyribodipyrimidine photolyase-related protein, partial [Candidatus Arcticimaribacter sp.]
MIVRLILGDQLNEQHSWIETADYNVLFVMMEIKQETDYVTHHIQKVVAFFAAMRNFNKRLIDLGHRTHYIKLDDTNNKQSLTDNLKSIFKEYKATKFEYQFPDEYRLDQQLL